MTEPDVLDKSVTYRQLELCRIEGVAWLACPLQLTAFVHLKSLETGEMPLEGIRWDDEQSGWCIWAGNAGDNVAGFTPVVVEKLVTLAPLCLSYLGLPVGWRFRVDQDDWTVWYAPAERQEVLGE